METPLEIAFKDTPTSEYLASLIRKRAERLDRFHPNLIGCRVVVDIPHRSAGTAKVPLRVAVEAEVPGRKLIGKSEQEDHEMKGDATAALNRAFDAVQRQIEDDVQVKRHQVKHHAAAPETGRVQRLYPDSDYGFVEMGDGPALYFTRNAVEGDAYDDLETGMMVQVTRATTEGPMGPQASSVRRLGGERTTTE